MGEFLVQFHLYILLTDLKLLFAEHWQFFLRNEHVHPVFDVPLVVGQAYGVHFIQLRVQLFLQFFGVAVSEG